jgi:hypothetical protein
MVSSKVNNRNSRFVGTNPLLGADMDNYIVPIPVRKSARISYSNEDIFGGDAFIGTNPMHAALRDQSLTQEGGREGGESHRIDISSDVDGGIELVSNPLHHRGKGEESIKIPSTVPPPPPPPPPMLPYVTATASYGDDGASDRDDEGTGTHDPSIPSTPNKTTDISIEKIEKKVQRLNARKSFAEKIKYYELMTLSGKGNAPVPSKTGTGTNNYTSTDSYKNKSRASNDEVFVDDLASEARYSEVFDDDERQQFSAVFDESRDESVTFSSTAGRTPFTGVDLLHHKDKLKRVEISPRKVVGIDPRDLIRGKNNLKKVEPPKSRVILGATYNLIAPKMLKSLVQTRGEKRKKYYKDEIFRGPYSGKEVVPVSVPMHLRRSLITPDLLLNMKQKLGSSKEIGIKRDARGIFTSKVTATMISKSVLVKKNILGNSLTHLLTHTSTHSLTHSLRL